jgi:hypothetical protein
MKNCFFKGVQGRIELLHMHTSQSGLSLTEIRKYMLERTYRISQACAHLLVCSAHYASYVPTGNIYIYI